MSPVLAMIGRDVLGLHTKVKDVEKSLGRWALATGGAAAVMGGVAMIGGMIKLAEKGSEVNHQLELMKIQGASFAETQEATAAAMSVTGKVMTTTLSENIKHVRELRYAFGDTADAVRYLETVSKSNAILNAMNGGKGAGGRDQVWELVKSLEQKGLTAKPEEFQSYVDQMTKAVVASGGKVTPAQFFAAFKYGRSAMLGWDEGFVTQYLPRLIQSMSGGSGGGTGGPGNALMSAFAKVVQGQMPKKAAEMFEEYGLGKATRIPGSSQSNVGAVKGADLFIHNPYEWVQKFLVPALSAKGINTPEKIIDVISKMFPVRTASQIVTEMALQGRAILGDLSPFEKDAKLQRQAFDQRMSYDELITKDYQTVMTAFHAQWENLQQVVGQPLTAPGGAVVSVLAHLTGLMNTISQFAAAHPQGLQIAIDVIASLAGALIVTGIIALAAALAPLIGIGAGLAGFVAFCASMFAIFGGAKNEAGPGQGALVPGGHGRRFQLNAIPPASAPGKQSSLEGGAIHVAMANVTLDGRKIGEANVRFMVGEGSGPAQGAPYHDSTRSTDPLDLALVG